MNRRVLAAVVAVAGLLSMSAAAAEAGDPKSGAELFRACAACHSLQADRNMTGPSLAGSWERKSGTLPSFMRYSPALKAANVVWNEDTLDPWLADPARFIPGNRMTFRGVKDAEARADLIAFLKEATGPGAPSTTAEQDGTMEGMMGADVPDLKTLGAAAQVKAITYCRDTYRVSMADGNVYEFWERNLRFKTDSSEEGPTPGTPSLVPAGMMGDRASVIFAAPEEISTLIKSRC